LHPLTFYKTYPKRTMAALAMVLSLAGGGALAIAGFDATLDNTPVRSVLETVTALTQTSSSADKALLLFRSDLSRTNDTADSLLNRLGVSDAQAASFLRTSAVARQNLLGRASRLVSVETNEGHQLNRMTVRWATEGSDQFSRWVVTRVGDTFTEQLEKAPLEANQRLGSGTIQSSLFAATDDANIPDSVAVQLADIFAGDIDFHRALRKGDRFSVVFESLEADGETLRAGRVVSAEFVNNGKTHQAFWFKDPSAKDGSKDGGGYYNADGMSLRRAYLASPLAFSRVTSGFKMRFHPILQTWRAHLGVDYAAPTGTAVRSVGQGVVDVAGEQGGFGNVVMVKHANGHTTVYAHLSRIMVKRGQTVSQNQTLGLVGATGWATGPHLHFEFRVNGRHQDPLTMARKSESTEISTAAREQFKRQASLAKVDLAAAASLQASRAE